MCTAHDAYSKSNRTIRYKGFFTVFSLGGRDGMRKPATPGKAISDDWRLVK